MRAIYSEVWALDSFQTSDVTVKVIKSHYFV